MASHALSIPASNSTVSVSIINTTSFARHFPLSQFFDDPSPGLDAFNLCSLAFLITHRDAAGKERNVVFDLGIRQDWQHYVPKIVERIESFNTEVEVEKQLVDILRQGGTKPEDVEAVLWRYGSSSV
jgi:hypothetical protein